MGGISFDSAILETSVGQISVQTPQALHFSAIIIGGIGYPPFLSVIGDCHNRCCTAGKFAPFIRPGRIPSVSFPVPPGHFNHALFLPYVQELVLQERICKRKIRSYMQPAGFFSLQSRKKDDLPAVDQIKCLQASHERE